MAEAFAGARQNRRHFTTLCLVLFVSSLFLSKTCSAQPYRVEVVVPPGVYRGVFHGRINDSADFAFLARRVGSPRDSIPAIFNGPNAEQDALVSEADGFDLIGKFDMNNDGTLVFWASNKNRPFGSTGPDASAIYRWDSETGIRTVVSDTTYRFFGFEDPFATYPAINNRGEIAFLASWSTKTKGGLANVFSGPDPIRGARIPKNLNDIGLGFDLSDTGHVVFAQGNPLGDHTVSLSTPKITELALGSCDNYSAITECPELGTFDYRHVSPFPRINDQGDVTFIARGPGPENQPTLLYTRNSELHRFTSSTISPHVTPSMTTLGPVFHAHYIAGPQVGDTGIFTIAGDDELDEIVSTQDVFAEGRAAKWLYHLDASSNGHVLFTFGSEPGQSGLAIARPLPLLLADFDGSGELSTADVNLLTTTLREEDKPIWFDLNGDQVVSVLDRDFMIEDFFDTTFGDANLDGRVDLADFQSLQLGFGRRGDWEHGDFDGNGIVAFSDFVQLSQNFGDGVQPWTVPEPSSLALFAFVLVLGNFRPRRTLAG